MLTKYQDFLKQSLDSDSEFARSYKELDLPSMIASQIIELREERGWTQAHLAKKVMTTQSSIARLENMNSLPSLSFLKRVADALGAEIEVSFVMK